MDKREKSRSPEKASSAKADNEIEERLLSSLKSSWCQFDGAGSHLLGELCNSLSGSQYDSVCKEIVALLGPVFGCAESELVLRRLKEMEGLLQHEPATGGKTDGTATSSCDKQNILRCLLLFIKLQAEYHLLCSNLVSSAIDHLNTSGEDQNNIDLQQQIKSLELRCLSVPLSSPIKHKKSSIAGISSPKTQKHGSLKASLFSFFERKNSPEESHSSFYVDIDQQAKEGGTLHNNEVASGESQASTEVHVTDSSQSDILVDLGLDPSPSEGSKSTPQLSPPVTGNNVPTVEGNGHVASQEELDSVINLLSGAGFGRATMQTIPEQRNPTSPGNHPGSLTPSSSLQLPNSEYQLSSLSPATSDNLHDRNLTLRSKGQRRSEGSIDVSGFSSPGHNTWPNQHRASLPGGQLAPPQITYDFATPPPSHPSYGTSYRPSTLPPGGAGHFQTAYGMGFPDPKLNRTWPVNNLATSGCVMDTINGSWSGGQDSDDLSDDSSCGDQYQAISHLQYTDNRRDVYKNSCESPYKKEERPGDVKHHSLEDLLDGRSNTWPQQLQPWSHSQLGMDLIGPQDQGPYHRPISMQMSDPLSRRNIWQNTGSEIPIQQHHQQQSQSVQGGLGQM